MNIVNLIDRFSDRYDFFVVTRNYDSKGDTGPYKSVNTNEWNSLDNAQVYYYGEPKLTPARAAHLAAEVKPDAFFANSVFSGTLLSLLTARRKGMLEDIPVVLAVCGELAKGALSVKPVRKSLFLAYARSIGLYDGVIWKRRSSRRQKILVVYLYGRRGHGRFGSRSKATLPDYSQSWKPVK